MASKHINNIPDDDFNYYLNNIYWNNFYEVIDKHNYLISGDQRVDWKEYVKANYGTCSTALFVHCGNGWVERDFFRAGLINSVIGTDVSQALLDEADAAAMQLDMQHSYVRVDTNTARFETFDYDWVVNHAAFHHIAFIDHAVRSLARGMKPNGLLIGYDYTGPHRNQYPWPVWSAMLELQASLPREHRNDLRYPHLPTMLHMDPTEAIHSELILDIVSRYFDFLELRPLGGAMAYELLFKNKNLHLLQETPEGRASVGRILQADWDFTQNDPKRSFFNFWVAAPRASALEDQSQLDQWTAEEVEREERAAANGGRYFPTQPLELIYREISDLRDEVRRLGGVTDFWSKKFE
jgi:SAM-dependent methyltransferase